MRNLGYQEQVLKDLSLFLDAVNENGDIKKGWCDYWGSKDILIGTNGAQPYQNRIPGVPHVCMKVPTGGGKTFMACMAVREIFRRLPADRSKLVVWLVPSDSILTQTVRTLTDTNHPYRQKLDMDFAGRVGVYTKEMLLNGQNFSPDTVREILTVCVLSYASLRIDSRKKDVRKVYQENGNLARFADFFDDKSVLLADTPDTALIQVLRGLSPAVIVDESHNAGSKLSTDMLGNLNPSVILELTATPRSKSNIISYVDARELKKENMVKLPVIVFNRNNVQTVISDAIQLRGNIEKQAMDEEAAGGSYIRPIILFQAQPNLNDESETFEKIRELLLAMGIPEEQIGIKTSKVDTIKNIDLMSRDCEVRYIITVNALKEGWDCPFAYILASLANKTSKVDVEQILGRILRQPYAKKHKATLLNTSYVLSCSNDFQATIDSVIRGLNNSGFSRKDCRVAEEESETSISQPSDPQSSNQQMTFVQENKEADGQPDTWEVEANVSGQVEIQDDIFSSVDALAVKQSLEQTQKSSSESLQKMIEDAKEQAEEYDAGLAEDDGGLVGGEFGEMLNQKAVKENFREEIQVLRIPQFVLGMAPTLPGFEQEYDILEEEDLSKGFSLTNQDAHVNFGLTVDKVAEVDIKDSSEATPEYKWAPQNVSEYYRQYLESFPAEERIEKCSKLIANQVNKNNRYATTEVIDYVIRVTDGMNDNDLALLETSIPSYARKISDKISALEKVHRKKNFEMWLDSGKVGCEKTYAFPQVITPIRSIDIIPDSLYEAERDDMNGFERDVIDTIVASGKIRWWHRIIERKGFYINGWFKHYPDFMVMMKSGLLVIVEAKGDHLDGVDSREKLRLGRMWQQYAGQRYKYFMVFQNKELDMNGAYTLAEFENMLKEM